MSIYKDVMEEVRGGSSSSSSSEGEPADASHMNIPMLPFTNPSLSSKTNELISRRVMGAISATPTKDLLSSHSRRRLLLMMDSELDTSTYGSMTPRKRKLLTVKESERSKPTMDTSSILSKGGGGSGGGSGGGGGSPFIFVAISGGKTLYDELGIAMCNLENSECILSQVR
jgi:hypothetical protein